MAQFSNRRNALIQVKGEKEVLHYYKDFGNVAMSLLEVETMSDFQTLLENIRVSKHWLVYEYCRGTLSRLKQDHIRNTVNRSNSK